MADNREALEKARDYIKARQFDRARIILEDLPRDPTAQKWLRNLDKVDPTPKSFEEAEREIEEIRDELEEAESDLALVQKTARRTFTVSTALLIFFGSLLGSLFGAAADFGDAVDTFHNVRAMFYPEICIVGSDTILGAELGMAQEWAENFEEGREVRVNIDAIGSSNGVARAVEGGCANVLAMSEPMSDTQYERLSSNGIEVQCAAEIGYDIIVFITDINNPVEVAEGLALRRMLLGTDTNWGSLDSSYDFPVTILVREGSGTTDVVLREIGLIFDSNGGRNFPEEANYVTCDSNEDCLNRTLGTRGSLYWVSAAWMSTQPPQYLRVLRVLINEDISVNPLTDEVNLQNYPRDLQRPLYMYVLKSDDTSEDQVRLAREFLEYVRGVEGQSILSDRFFYTYFNQPSDIDVPLPPGFDPVGTPNRQICRG